MNQEKSNFRWGEEGGYETIWGIFAAKKGAQYEIESLGSASSVLLLTKWYVVICNR